MKKKSELFKKRPSEKEKEKKMVVNKRKRNIWWKIKKNRIAIWALLCKVSGIDDIWKEKIVLH